MIQDNTKAHENTDNKFNKPGCSHHVSIEEHCRLDSTEQDPSKRQKCETLKKIFRKCPGEPAELVERSKITKNGDNIMDDFAETLPMVPGFGIGEGASQPHTRNFMDPFSMMEDMIRSFGGFGMSMDNHFDQRRGESIPHHGMTEWNVPPPPHRRHQEENATDTMHAKRRAHMYGGTEI